MTPEQLQRAHITAVALGQNQIASKLAQGFEKIGLETAFHYTVAMCMVALEHRFGDRESGIDYAELDRFIAEVRRDFRHAEPPLGRLAMEGLIRAMYGEDYLLDFLTQSEQDTYARILLFWQVDHVPELKDGLDDAIDEAREIIASWIFG